MTFSSSQQNGWKWYDGKLIVVLVCYTGSQLPPTVMKPSHTVKVTKRDMYLSDGNLPGDASSIT